MIVKLNQTLKTIDGKPVHVAPIANHIVQMGQLGILTPAEVAAKLGNLKEEDQPTHTVGSMLFEALTGQLMKDGQPEQPTPPKRSSAPVWPRKSTRPTKPTSATTISRLPKTSPAAPVCQTSCWPSGAPSTQSRKNHR